MAESNIGDVWSTLKVNNSDVCMVNLLFSLELCSNAL